MKHLTLFFLLASTLGYTAEVPKLCYDKLEGGQFCTTDNIGSVQAFIYNAGWCGPCNQEMSEVAPQFSQFQGKKVVFASLSGEGYSHGSRPDAAFLQNWKDKYKIPFVVAGKYRDFGNSFPGSGAIPFAVIVDHKGNVVQSANMGPSEIFSKVKTLIQKMEQEEVILAKPFFEKLRGKYDVISVGGSPVSHPENKAEIYVDAEFPTLEMVYVPYCVEQLCMDSGNYFVYDNTTIVKTANGYQISLKSDSSSKVLKYDWEPRADGTVLYRNYQFVDQHQATITLEHILKKATD